MASLALQIGLFLLGSTCFFAWWKGGPAERAGATIVAVAWISSLAVQEIMPVKMQPVSLLVFDGALAAALLMVAIRYASHWLGAAMLLQAFMLAVHAEQLGDDGGIGRVTYIVILNAGSAAMLLTIVASTVGAWMKRTQLRRAANMAATPPGVVHPV